jgi:RNA polymerase sigma-70 factor, ECF subfamily
MAELTNISDGISDDVLLRQSAAGDEQAFIALYRRRQSSIYRFALHMSGSETLAEEVTQEVFLAVIREGSRFDSALGSAAAYLFGMTRKQVLKHLDRDRGYNAMEDAPEPVDGASPLTDLTRAETIEAVRQAVLSLPEAYREAVVLCDLEEMSYADAAAVLSVPLGTVRSRLSRARTLLAGKLSLAMRCFA